MKNYLSTLSLLLPLALFLGAVFLRSSGALETSRIYILTEVFISGVILLSIPLIYYQKWSSDRNVLRGLRQLFFLVFLTYFLFLLFKQINGAFGIRLTHSSYFSLVAWSAYSLIFVLISIGILRNLIFIKRKRSTLRNFSALLFFLVFYALLGLLNQRLDIPKEVVDSIHYFVLFVLLILMVINSLRVSWINYLNKRQKIVLFWIGLLLLPFMIHLTVSYFQSSPIFSFSVVLHRFVNYCILMLTIYMSFAVIGLLAHLPTAQLFDRKIRQIESMHNLSRAISTEFDLNKLVVLIVKLVSDVTESDFVWLELYDDKNKKLKLVSSRNLKEREKKNREIFYHKQLIAFLADKSDPLLVNQVSKDTNAKSLLAWKRDIGSVLIVPLHGGEKTIGFLYAAKRQEFAFEQDDISMLRAFGEQVTIALENARLIKASIEKERLQQELRIAHYAQMKLLPKAMPDLQGVNIDAICRTANEVGGDYYDFLRLNDHLLGVVIGDVSGKGTSAAFYMAEVKGIINALAKTQASPAKILSEVNRTLYPNIERNQFISMVYGVLDARKKTFTFARAGHCPLLLAKSGSDDLVILEPSGMCLGLDGGEIFEKIIEEKKIQLDPNDTILLYTDGAIEERNKNNEEFGEERLYRAFCQYKSQSVSEIKLNLLNYIYKFVEDEKSFDDLTFVLIQAEKFTA